MKRTTILGICMTALVAIAVWAPNVLAFPNGSDCADCHSFKGTSHDNHTAEYGCFVCHVQKGDDPVVVDSCGTCHDPVPLQTFHVVNKGKSCDDCHNIAPPPPACNDNDGDGYGNPGASACANSAEDCNDNNTSINPGAVENCTDGRDNDCDYLIDSDDPSAVNCPANCTDLDQDGYKIDGGECGPVDCNDNDEFISPAEPEDCSDTYDNDCDGQTDCNDKDCARDTACVAESCTDYGDRGSCKADPSCNYSRKRGCYEVIDGSIYTDQSSCEDAFGRWNRKKEKCTIR